MTTTFIGIDPGVNGGIALITEDTVTSHKMPETEGDICGLLWAIYSNSPNASWERDTGCHKSIRAVIEEQRPRPTRWFSPVTKAWQQSILKSTCLLYGQYLQIRGMLLAIGIPFEDCPPRRWQKDVGLPDKEKGEKDGPWKNKAKVKAQGLFPDVKVTLATADALLIAEHCRRRFSNISEKVVAR